MHCTANAENGDYIDDLTWARLADQIAGMGQPSATFVTTTPPTTTRAGMHPSACCPTALPR
jgi:hypothetical protein